jgi:hypothetical protein
MPALNPDDLTVEQSKALLKASLETIYLDGIDEILDYALDPDKGAEGTMWGSFRDGEKVFEFEYNLAKNELTY